MSSSSSSLDGGNLIAHARAFPLLPRNVCSLLSSSIVQSVIDCVLNYATDDDNDELITITLKTLL